MLAWNSTSRRFQQKVPTDAHASAVASKVEHEGVPSLACIAQGRDLLADVGTSDRLAALATLAEYDHVGWWYRIHLLHMHATIATLAQGHAVQVE
jgi:hypothetical protein